MNHPIELTAEHRAIVQAVLRQHLPPGAKVWVFGSRATGRAYRGSDLDLAIDAGQPLPYPTQSELGFAFEDSDLPYTVDVLDMHSLPDDAFRRNIQKVMLPLDWQKIEAGSAVE